MIKNWSPLRSNTTQIKTEKSHSFFAQGLLRPDFDPKKTVHVEQTLQYLLNVTLDNGTVANNWFALFQELSLTVTELHSQLELNTHLDVQSSVHSNALRLFESQVLVLLLEARQKLTNIYLACPWKNSMHADDRGLLAKDLMSRIPLTAPSLAKWQLKESHLVQQYKQTFQRSTAVWQSRTVPLSVVNGFLSHTSEAIRKQAFVVYWGALRNKKQEFENIFCELVEIRKSIASQAGFKSYAQCAFVETGRSSYTPQESVDFNEMLCKNQNRYLEPLLNSIPESSLPWNYQALASLLPSHPPCTGDLVAIEQATAKMMADIHPSCGQLYAELLSKDRLDIHPRGNKAGGAFCVNFPKSKIPFVFGNFSGRFKDAMTLVHEFGHAYHSHLSSFVSNHLLRTPSMEFCEFAASSFELLALQNLKHWYKDPSQFTAAHKQHLAGVLIFFPLMSSIDDFQHQIYDPTFTLNPSDIGKAWTAVSRKYRSQIDWSQCPEFEELGWLCRSHIFTSPFYFFEYGVAYLAALDFISKYQHNPEIALSRFFEALQLGAQRPLPQLFETAGVYFAMGKSEKNSSEAVVILERVLHDVLVL